MEFTAVECSARATIEQHTIRVDVTDVRVGPGMVVIADFKFGKRHRRGTGGFQGKVFQGLGNKNTATQIRRLGFRDGDLLNVEHRSYCFAGPASRAALSARHVSERAQITGRE